MIEEILSYLVLFGVGTLAFFSIKDNVFSNRKRTDTIRTELETARKYQQDATREITNARTTVNDIRQSTSELADETRTSESIINECKQIIEEIRNKNDMEASR
jgi:peptidoglycan hydrolase CwlO-like protein